MARRHAEDRAAPAAALTFEGHHTSERGIESSMSVTVPAELLAVVDERGSGPEWYDQLGARRAFLKVVDASIARAAREARESSVAEWNRQHPAVYPTPVPVTFPMARVS